MLVIGESPESHAWPICGEELTYSGKFLELLTAYFGAVPLESKQKIDGNKRSFAR
jgi:hypothetical protein